MIKLVGADDRGLKGNYVMISVPTYKVVIVDGENSNFRMESTVTRDSWSIDKFSNNIATISNSAFEPANENENEYDTIYNAPYPHENDTAAYALEQNGSSVLKSEPRKNERGEIVTIASSIMIHVGGIYHNEKDATLDNKARTRAGGSKGCFGIVNIGNSFKNPSDTETKRVIDGIRKQSDDNAFFGYSDVKVITQKRKYVERTKQVSVPKQ